MTSLAPDESQTATASPAPPVAAPAPPTATPPDAPAPPPTATATFGVLTTTDSKLSDASNPPRDGRIRNPVPSKLQGLTDESKGNFHVMHMDVAGRTEAAERDAEAKRTSEGTELAARRAFESGYIAQKKTRYIHLPGGDQPKPFIPAATPAPNTSAPTQSTRLEPLNPAETKSEQARLLNLLQSLHPALVVDQICKALMFFGGVPDAPPPADGLFPLSAEANGSGSLFVGWIAEIFPKLGGNVPGLERRKRGRPKGSKGTKSRVDKGIRRGPLSKIDSALDEPQPVDGGGGTGSTVDERWANVDDDGMEPQDDVDANVLLLAQASTPQPQYEGQNVPQAPGSAPGPAPGPASQPVSTPARASLLAPSADPLASVDLTGSAKKRGRPRGSKNRPRDGSAAKTEGPSEWSQPPESNALQRQSFTAINSSSSASPLSARMGNKVDSREGQDTQTVSGNGSGTGSAASTLANSAQKGLSATQAQGLTLPTPPTVSPAMGNFRTTSGGQKRKRKNEKDGAAPQGSLNGDARISNSSPQMNGLALPTPPSNTGQSSVTTTATATNPRIPSAKRQRKGKTRSINGTIVGGITDAEDASAQAPASLTHRNSSSETSKPGSAHMSAPMPNEHDIPSMSSLHSTQTQFDLQSPTVDNYDAQLQAQLETEIEQPGVTHYSRDGSSQSMASRHQQQQQQQQQSQFQPRQHPSQQLPQHHHHHHHHSTASHSKSPSIQSTKSQTSTPLLAGQSQTRGSYSQYQYTQPQAYNSSHTHQPSSAQQQPQFASHQHHGQGSQPSSTPQYSSTQQPYSATQQQASQQRYQLPTSSASTTAYPTHQPPHFGNTASNSYTATADGTYRSSATSLGASSYSQRSQSGTPSTTAPFRANSGHSLSHHSPSYSTATNSVQPHQRSSSTSHNTTQSMQGISSTMQSFPGSAASDWGLFDASHLDTSGQQAAIGLSNPSYGLGTTNVRAPNNAGAAYAAGLASFDATALGGNNRYYNVGRR
ncbi:hypothetical protein QBC38DRAFT_359226 [Podospora fimiseda]|uniref:Uncharacterized protein n=1 Tax=Podospora fimiseda TaxID=252190 RepID=A0AAN7BU96_9PEZI|nr:hypothetical protein QBC38DRAFT_359226 [Podospora fimiseda]